MGHKVNPLSIRNTLSKAWRSRWFAKRDYRAKLLEDLQIRKFIEKKFGSFGGIARVEIERGSQDITIIIHTSRPGILIGRGGQGISTLKQEIEKILQDIRGGNRKVKLTIVEIKKPDLEAPLVASGIANQLSRRIAFKRAMRQAAERVMASGAQGVRIRLSGRLGGVEIARTQSLTVGTLPLSRFTADIDFVTVAAPTTYGTIGVKVWIHRGLLAPQESNADAA